MPIQAIPSIFLPPIPKFIEQMPVRMTVVKTSHDKLWLHSPVPLTDSLKTSLDQLGVVECVVAPSLLHHVNILTYAEKFPQAHCFVAKNLQKKRPETSALNRLEDLGEDYFPFLKKILLAGHNSEETAFYHPLSKTLIVADLCYNVGREHGILGRMFFRIVGAYGKPALPFYHRLAVRDRHALKASLEKILSWDFDRIILSHGSMIHSEAKEKFKDMWQWALK